MPHLFLQERKGRSGLTSLFSGFLILTEGLHSSTEGIQSSVSKSKHGHRMADIGRNFWTSSCPNPLLKQACPQQGACSDTFMDGDSPTSWGNLCQGLVNLPVKISSCSKNTSHVSICAHHYWSCYWAPLKRDSRFSLHLPFGYLNTCVRSH